MGLINRLFGKNRSDENVDSRGSLTESAKTADSTDALMELKRNIDGIGHAEHPFNSREFLYGPDSRVPCVDFTPFIANRLEAGDRKSIHLLMRELIRANPGLWLTMGDESFDPTDWVVEQVDLVLSRPLEDFISYDDYAALNELRALWVLEARRGAFGEHWVRTPIGRYAALALSCYQVSFAEKSTALISLANKYILMQRADDSEAENVWQGVPLFDEDVMMTGEKVTSQADLIMRELTPASRIQLLDACSKGAVSLLGFGKGISHYIGLDIDTSGKALIDSTLLVYADKPEGLAAGYTKDELLAECQNCGALVRKSWNKSRLIECLAEASPDRVAALIQERRIVTPNPLYAAELTKTMHYAEALKIPYSLLAFA